MSLAVLTDSTTAHESPVFSFRPTAGNSTNTTSVSSCCAWSVMPMVATSSSTRTHSWDFAYFKSGGIFELINQPASFPTGGTYLHLIFQQHQDGFWYSGFLATIAGERLPRISISMGVPGAANSMGT